MANLNIKNFDDRLYDELKICAIRNKMGMRDLVQEGVGLALARHSGGVPSVFAKLEFGGKGKPISIETTPVPDKRKGKRG